MGTGNACLECKASELWAEQAVFAEQQEVAGDCLLITPQCTVVELQGNRGGRLCVCDDCRLQALLTAKLLLLAALQKLAD